MIAAGGRVFLLTTGYSRKGLWHVKSVKRLLVLLSAAFEIDNHKI